MTAIGRHNIEISNWPEMLVGRRARLQLLRTRPVRTIAPQLSGLADLGQTLLALTSLLDRDSPDQAIAARCYAQGYAGRLALASDAQGVAVELPFIDARATFTATGPTSAAHVTAWIDGWYGGLMSRDTASLDQLAAVDDGVLAASSTRADPYHVSWKAALVAMRNKNHATAVDHTRAALELTRGHSRRIAGAAVSAVDAATFAMLPPIIERDASAWHDALANALNAHRDLYSACDPRGGDHKGFIAWGPLALTCLAHDSGLAIGVESDYLLPDLIRHRFQR